MDNIYRLLWIIDLGIFNNNIFYLFEVLENDNKMLREFLIWFFKEDN